MVLGFLIAGAIIVLVVFAPKIGLFAGITKAVRVGGLRLEEDALKLLFERANAGEIVNTEMLAGSFRLGPRRLLRLLERLESKALIRSAGNRLELTADGERLALQTLRAHRLWEQYLATEARLPLPRVHAAAHRLEHRSESKEIEDLEASLGYPHTDPHGDPIPDRDGNISEPEDLVALNALDVGVPARIVHLEDEPRVVFSQIIAEGLRPGQTVRILEAGPERIVLTEGENEIRLAPAVAANVFVTRETGVIAERHVPLSELPDSESGTISSIDPRCQGFTRRRFLDLGLTPGTRVSAALTNAFGDPRAYRVRGTLIALRKEQANMVLVDPGSLE